jgi:hypothetical protein
VRYVVLIFAFFGLFLQANGQISPPGLDDTQAAAWGAVGFTQQAGKRWQSTFYIGAARESGSGNYSLLSKPAISVISLEQGYRFNDHWQLAGGISYRRQSMYEDTPARDMEREIRSEARYYARLYYRHSLGRINMTWSFRPEYRTYYGHHHAWDPVPVELRFRFKVQASIPFGNDDANQFVVGNEWLTATDHRVHAGETPHWTHYAFTEDRLTTYFRHTFKKPSVLVDVGLMYQVRPREGLITHLAFDLIFVNPFGAPAGGK